MEGDKTKIPYLEWHNYYRSRLLSRDAWAQSTFTFFNNTLFKATSTSEFDLIADRVEVDDWELEYQNAFEGGLVAPTSSNMSSSSHQEIPTSRSPIPSSVPGASISGAMGGLTLDGEQVPPPPPPLHQVVEDSIPAAALGTNNKGKVRGTKTKQKGKVVTVDEAGVGTGAAGYDDSGRVVLSNARKTRSGNKA